MPDFLYVLINSVASFVSMFIVAKILGKKQIAELSFVDYVVGISIGSIRLNIQNKKQLKNIIVAFYDDVNDKIIVHYK